MRHPRRPRATPSCPILSRPSAGLLQCDHEGQVWLCEAVIRNGEIADWYLVRLSRLEGSHPVGDPVVLSPSEYETFSLSRRLEPVLL